MAFRHALIIAPVLLSLIACETVQENPNYEYSSTYENGRNQVLAQNSRHPGQQQSAVPVRHVSATSAQPQTTVPVRYVNTTSAQQGAQIVQTSTHSGAVTSNSVTSGAGVAYTRVDASCVNGQTACQPQSIAPRHQQAIITPAYSPTGQANDANNYLLANHEGGQANNVFSEVEYAPSLTENAYSADTVGTPGYEILQQSRQQAPQQSYSAAQAQPNTTHFANVQAPHSANTQHALLPVTAPQSRPAWPQSQTEFSQSYTIKAGDTVYSLSRSLCASISDVQNLNGLNQDFTIKAGDTLQLPASTC